MRLSALALLTIMVGLLSSLPNFSQASRCLSEQSNPLDWFVIYKIPELKDEEDGHLASGQAYVFLSSEDKQAEKWHLSDHLIGSNQSLLARTLNQVYSDPSKHTYAMYNDELPVDAQKSNLTKNATNGHGSAHAKGILAMDAKDGFWIVHSVPKFAPKFDSAYAYPHNAIVYGQTIICLSFDTQKAAEDIVRQLLIIRPHIYDSAQSDEVSVLNFDQLMEGQWSDEDAGNVQLQSLVEETPFVSYAKGPANHIELYVDEIAPLLKEDLLVETWRKGAGGILESNCQNNFSVLNVEAVSLNFELGQGGRQRLSESNGFFGRLISFFSQLFKKKGEPTLALGQVSWNYRDDHAKWAISSEASKAHVCIADLNRMLSQSKRGGGALCFRNEMLWSVFKQSIGDLEPCPKDETKTN